MKDFLKFTLATVVGIILSSIILFIIGIVSIAGIVASSNTEVKVKENSFLFLDLNGELKERSQENPFSQFLGDEFATYGLDDVLSSIRKAKENENIKGIYLQTSYLTTSYASLEEIRNALIDFKESGKFLVAYADNYTQSMYYLASVSDKVMLNPQGSIDWRGLASQPIFYKDLLNKLGIEMQIFKVGTYKSAVEPFIANEMSPANREQMTEFMQSIWNRLLGDISTSRNITADSLNNLANRMITLSPAEEFVKCGMVDTLVYKDGVRNYLKQLTRLDESDNLNAVSLTEMINVRKNVPKDKSGNIIAIYYAYGDIDGSTNEGIVSKKVVRDLRKLREDDNVKSVVLRVNSPGGSAFGSEQIWHEVSLLKEKKPVIVSMGDYAASGGYYISCNADYIVADPTTLTGSIGIFGMIPNVKGLTDKIGVHFDMVKTNKYSDFGVFTRGLDTKEKELMQMYIDRGYQTFLTRCAEGRGMSMEEISKIAEGRIWTGSEAKNLGLVDELGGLDKAVEIAIERAKVEGYTVLSYPEKEDFFTALFKNKTTGFIQAHLEKSWGEYYKGIRFIQNLKDADKVQTRIPFELNIQ